MASRINEFDSAARPSWSKPSWHKLERVVEGEITSVDQIKEIACPVYTEDFPVKEGYSLAGTGCSKVVVADKGDRKIIISTASPEYRVFSNDRVLNSVFEAFRKTETPARLSFAVTMHNMARVNYCFELENASEFFIGTEKHTLLLNFYNSHDMAFGLRGFGSIVRGVCDNQCMLALKGPKEAFDFTFYHSKSGEAQLDNLPKMIEACQHHAAAYSKLADQMKNKTINQLQARAIAMSLLTRVSNGVSSVRNYNASEEIADLAFNGLGNAGLDNMYGLWNGVTQYFSSGNGSGKTVSPFKKMVSSSFGTAAEKKKEILTLLQRNDGDFLSDMDIDLLAASGERLLLEHA
jgi:hypothetical protein